MLSLGLLFLPPLFALLTMKLLYLIHRVLERPRYRPTVFTIPSESALTPQHLFPAPRKPFRRQSAQTNDVGERYRFVRRLGRGCEGSAAIYADMHGTPPQEVVIKSFYLSGVRHNPLPAHLLPVFGSRSWPSEIPATLYFANIHSPGGLPAAGRDERRTEAGFVYAIDYFAVAPGEWRLVTPFLRKGTLETLAQLVRCRYCAPEALDRIYRPRFRGIVEALQRMHRAGYAHDDVKMDNIFVSPTNAFLLGDLGNVREHGHDFHKRGGGRQEGVAGDMERAMKTYLAFLREASGQRRWFDEEFWRQEPQQEWSRFFWSCKRGECEIHEPAFWGGAATGAGGVEEFEREVDSMRLDLEKWRKEGRAEPLWWRGEREGGEEGLGELECVSPGVLEKLMPWLAKKQAFAESDY